MGVRGLTTFIERNDKVYLKPYDLHNTYLVIDGSNLSAELYRRCRKCYYCFGGDYDVYAKVITDFFEVLKKCNITPLVIFDGAYEDRKLDTIYRRVEGRHKLAKECCAATEGRVVIYPIFLRDLFMQTVIRLGIKTIRYDFEADFEMACLARALDCPLLSEDSDFFIFDVSYIPFSTLNIRSVLVKKDTGDYYVVKCRLYRIENLLESLGGMDKTNLPLLAVLLGNDYIKKKVFSKFYQQLEYISKQNLANEQLRIGTVIKWLSKQTYETAITAILRSVKAANRREVASLIKEVVDGYICTNSKLLPLLDIPAKPIVSQQEQLSLEIDVESIINNSPEDEESDDDIDPGVRYVSEIKVLSEHFPEWFLKEYRACQFLSWIMELPVHNRHVFIPQVDNHEDIHSHEISVDLVSHLHKLLTSGKKPEFTYVARDENAKLQDHPHETSTLDLPTLEEIIDLDVKTRKDTLLKILGLNETVYTVLSKFPEDWHVFVLSIRYWMKKSGADVSNNHVYALLMCALVTKIADAKLGHCRSLELAQQYEINFISQAGVDKPDDKGISKKDCLNYLMEMIPYFSMNRKMSGDPKIFDLRIVHAFARFQSCLLHIKYINMVLNKPFENFLVSDFYNGTCIYGLFAELNNRSDAMKSLSRDAKGIFKYFTMISSAVLENLDAVAATPGSSRRKRRNRRKGGQKEQK